jgi:cation diffusion facilitator CzcD-associated flavoprotein CzcO
MQWNAQGRDVFQGKDIFAKELTTENLGVARDLDVVVIGSGKTAWDVAGAAAEVAASVTLLGRQVLSRPLPIRWQRPLMEEVNRLETAIVEQC